MPVKAVLAVAFGCAAFGQTSHVFQFTYIQTPKGLEQVSTTIKVVAEIQQVQVYSGSASMAVEGTADQIALTTWLVKALDQPVTQTAREVKYTMPASPTPEVRISWLANSQLARDPSDVAISLRSIAEMQRITIVGAVNAIVYRGTADDVALSEWMIAALDKVSQSPGLLDYAMPTGTPNPSVRLFYLNLPENTSIPTLNQINRQVRTETQIMRVAEHVRLRALVARGTPDQIAQATNLIQQSKLN